MTATAPALAPAVPVAHAQTDPKWRAARRRWATLIRRLYEADPLVCLRCRGPMRIIAFITEPRVIHKIRGTSP